MGYKDPREELYYTLLEQLRAENEEDVAKVLETLHKTSNENLIALACFLYPELAICDEKTSKLIEALKEKGKKNFIAKREGNEVTVEIL